MALLRIKRPEHLTERDPAAFGRLLGLDRAPEVKTLRRRLTRLAAPIAPSSWVRSLRVCVSISVGISWASRFCGPRSNATLDDLGISIALFKDAALALFLWPYLCADRA